MFSSTAEYALRAIIHLATNRQKASTSKEIALVTKVPPSYISKVLGDLVTAGLVTSQRGPNGGFVLARDPKDISVLEAVNAVDPIRRIITCPLEIPSHGTRLCRLHHRLDDAIRMVEDTLRSASIAEMCETGRGESRCLFPSVTVEGQAPAARRAKKR